MKNRFAIFLSLGFLFLTGCVTLAPSPTATPEPIETPVLILATSVDDLIGIWQLGSGTFGLFFQFNEDGTYRVAQRVDTNLQDSPTQMGQFMLEGGLLTLVTGEESPLCASQTGTYVVHLMEQGRIDFVLQDDPCILRAETSYSGLERLSP